MSRYERRFYFLFFLNVIVKLVTVIESRSYNVQQFCVSDVLVPTVEQKRERDACLPQAHGLGECVFIAVRQFVYVRCLTE